MLKKCTRCLIEQELSCFNASQCHKDRKDPWCKTCKHSYNKIKDAERYQRIKVLRIAQVKEWQRNNVAKRNAIENKRRAMQLQATPKWLTEDHFKLIEMKYELAHYLSECTGEIWTVDHIIPLKGKNVRGLHVPWNLRVITKSENSSKCNKYE